MGRGRVVKIANLDKPKHILEGIAGYREVILSPHAYEWCMENPSSAVSSVSHRVMDAAILLRPFYEQLQTLPIGKSWLLMFCYSKVDHLRLCRHFVPIP